MQGNGEKLCFLNIWSDSGRWVDLKRFQHTLVLGLSRNYPVIWISWELVPYPWYDLLHSHKHFPMSNSVSSKMSWIEILYCVTVIYTINIHQVLLEMLIFISKNYSIIKKVLRADSMRKSQIKTLIETLHIWLGLHWKQSSFWNAFNRQNTWKSWISELKSKEINNW